MTGDCFIKDGMSFLWFTPKLAVSLMHLGNKGLNAELQLELPSETPKKFLYDSLYMKSNSCSSLISEDVVRCVEDTLDCPISDLLTLFLCPNVCCIGCSVCFCSLCCTAVCLDVSVLHVRVKKYSLVVLVISILLWKMTTQAYKC